MREKERNAILMIVGFCPEDVKKGTAASVFRTPWVSEELDPGKQKQKGDLRVTGSRSFFGK